MNRIDLLYGFLIGIVVCVIGMALFLFGTLLAYPEVSISEMYSRLVARGRLGQMIALGAFLNLVAFFLLLRLKIELMARGIILSVIVLTIVTLFI